MSEFRFEHTRNLSEREYVALFGLLPGGTRQRWLRRAVVVIVGIACLFFPYTLLLGVAILALAAIAFVAPYYLPGTASRVYQETLYLHGPVTYGVTHEKLWVHATELSSELSWRHVTTWLERDGWFILRGNGFPLLMFPVGELEAAGVHGRVRALAARHGVEFKGRRVRGRLTDRFSGPASPQERRRVTAEELDRIRSQMPTPKVFGEVERLRIPASGNG